MKTMKDIITCALKCDVLLLADGLKFTRDGIYISNRYSKVNNKYLKSYDPKQESKHIYLDTNNLYGYAMSKFFPAGRFEDPNGKWIDCNEFDLNKYTNNSSKECVL